MASEDARGPETAPRFSGSQLIRVYADFYVAAAKSLANSKSGSSARTARAQNLRNLRTGFLQTARTDTLS
jgi:hypothetical protein